VNRCVSDARTLRYSQTDAVRTLIGACDPHSTAGPSISSAPREAQGLLMAVKHEVVFAVIALEAKPLMGRR